MEMNMDLPLADRNWANSMEMAIMESGLDSGYYELKTDGRLQLELQDLINTIDVDGQLLPAYEMSGAEKGGLGAELEQFVVLVEQTPKIETWATDDTTGPGPVDLPTLCFYTSTATAGGDYNLSEESRVITAAVSHCPQSQIDNALPLPLEPNQLAGSDSSDTPPAPDVVSAIIEEKNPSSSGKEALTDFKEKLVNQAPPSTADQYLIEVSENEGVHTSEVPEPVRVPPTNIRVVVKNKEEFMESAMKCGINPAELKVNDKLTRKCPGRTRSLKRFVPPEEVTPGYLAKRAKNTESARRSRDSKRVRENELILRTVFLEEKYEQLKARYEELLQLKATKLEARAARMSVQN